MTTKLTAPGVSMLLVYGAKLLPPRDGKPGIRVTVQTDGSCLLETVGYPCPTAAAQAIEAARQTCLDCELEVLPATTIVHGFIVRKKNGVHS